MARIFITGSSDGLGLAAAWQLAERGHDVLLHARSAERAATLTRRPSRTLGVVTGDLASAAETDSIAEQVLAFGALDAVIHNAGIYNQQTRDPSPEDHAAILAVNVLAPYRLTCLMPRPERLVFMSSALHREGVGPIDDIDWTTRPWNGGKAYAESKLYMVALAFALARRWPKVFSNAVDPGWVRTRMGGADAPVDLETGARTQAWLAGSDDAEVRTSGGYWKDQQKQRPAGQAADPAFQDALIARLDALTGLALAPV